MADFKADSVTTMELLNGVSASDSRSFEQLFLRHRAFIRRVVDLRLDRKLRARVDPSDIVQETQLEAFRRLPDYLRRKPMPFRLWLRKTACERLTMIRRRHVHAVRRSVDLEMPLPNKSSVQQGETLKAGGSTPSQQAGRRELASRVQNAIEELPPPDREILLLRHYEGLTHDEAARVLKIESATARKRYGRALLRLHRRLSELGLTESQI
jgi:RNA polymerase sigma-70 factor (ECF subfamily)